MRPSIALLLLAVVACGPRPTHQTVYGRSHNESRVAEAAAEDLGCANESIDVHEVEGHRYAAEGCGQRAVYRLACAPVAGTTGCVPKLESQEAVP